MYYLAENTTGQSKESPCKLIYHCTSPYNFGQDVNYISYKQNYNHYRVCMGIFSKDYVTAAHN